MLDYKANENRRHSLSNSINIVMYVLLAVSVSVTCFMMFVMEPRVQRVNSIRQQASRTESQLWKIAFLTNRLTLSSENERQAAITDLVSETNSFSNNLNYLSDRIPTDLRDIRYQVVQAHNSWNEVRKSIDKIVLEAQNGQDLSKISQTEVEKKVKGIMSSLNDASSSLSRRTEETSVKSSMLSTSVYVLIILLVAWIFLLMRTITRRLGTLHNNALKIAGGDYGVHTECTGNDELTDLAETFNLMTSQIDKRLKSERKARQQVEQMLKTLSETAEKLATSASDILTATTEQAAAMSEEAAAVQQTSVTVEELKQVTALSTQKANLVATLAQQSEEVTQCGREAVERSVEGMLKVREEVQSLATSMQRLSEQTQAVGEIISTVQDIAEQSNMLAVNAAIEAARAGEHGYGFSVVANEVRVLAEQSRQATVQVRSILGEIQKAVTTALNNTEAESKSVEAGVELVNQAGEVIRSLTETISHSSNAANQIRASSDQHAAGVDQIALAITAIRDASVQALNNTHQTEQQAKMLRDISFSLNSMLKESNSESQRGGELQVK